MENKSLKKSKKGFLEIKVVALLSSFIMLMVVCLLLSSCSETNQGNKDLSNYIRLFRPASNLHAEDMRTMNFDEVLGSDIPMYSFAENDTTVVFSLNIDETRILNQMWLVKFDTLTKESVLSLLADYNALIRIGGDSDIIKHRNLFAVKSLKHNQLYECYVDREDQTLVIVYYHGQTSL